MGWKVTPKPRELTQSERITLQACMATVWHEAEAMICSKPHIIDSGDLEGDLLHAAAHIVAAFTRRTHSKLMDRP
jgi:hypothetical protein